MSCCFRRAEFGCAFALFVNTSVVRVVIVRTNTYTAKATLSRLEWQRVWGDATSRLERQCVCVCVGGGGGMPTLCLERQWVCMGTLISHFFIETVGETLRNFRSSSVPVLGSVQKSRKLILICYHYLID